jgi:hypothetical protein
MNEAMAVIALVILSLFVISALILLLRKAVGGTDEFGEAQYDPLAAPVQWSECPHDTIAHIFGAEDLGFVRATGSERLCRSFRNERRQIALNWVRGTFAETHRIMSHHFRTVRSSPDLSLSLEAKLVAEFFLHQTMCLMLMGGIRVAGPDGLARLAGAVGSLRHQVGTVIEKLPETAPGNFAGGSSLGIHN